MTAAADSVQGPLKGVRVVEFAGLGPAPFCGMLLADLGADVICVDRKGAKFDPSLTRRGRRSIALDLKRPEAVEACLRLLAGAEMLLEGFRPGVMERLGLGPDVALPLSPGLVYGRMTGWGQDGPYAQAAGHDLNYIAISGALNGIGPYENPVIPLNLVGDFAGATFLAFGMVAALLHARTSKQGQVVDCAMSEGAASLATLLFGMQQMGQWKDRRCSNIVDGAAHFYNCYRCADGEWITVAAIEPQFYRLLRDALGLDDPAFDAQYDETAWPALRERVAAVIATRSRVEWLSVFEGTDCCVAPVMSLVDAPTHPQNVARGVFVERDGIVQPGPVPRFSQTPGAVGSSPPLTGADNESALSDWGFSRADIGALIGSGAM